MLTDDFSVTHEKISETCHKNKLVFNLECRKFPVIATLSPDLETFNQMQFDFGDMERKEKSNYINGQIKFIFGDELQVNILNDFLIEDKLLNKIKGLVKNLHYIYLQLYFKDKTEFDKVNYNKGGNKDND